MKIGIIIRLHHIGDPCIVELNRFPQALGGMTGKWGNDAGIGKTYSELNVMNYKKKGGENNEK
ncbi:hypothetical protein HGA88_03310 [Candidatus Roizmanbacteria bacterium]|nr:hypothetical protein [Candidatus Roizmanbacteria bacterium]